MRIWFFIVFAFYLSFVVAEEVNNSIQEGLFRDGENLGYSISSADVKYDNRIIERFEKDKLNQSLNDTEIYIRVMIKLHNNNSDFFVENYLDKGVRDLVNRNFSDAIGVDITEEVFYP